MGKGLQEAYINPDIGEKPKGINLGIITIQPIDGKIPKSGDIGKQFGINSTWLDSRFRSTGIAYDKNGKIIEDHLLTEPRLGDIYSLVSNNGNYELHRFRNRKELYIVIPPEFVLPRQNTFTYTALNSLAQEITPEIESA